MQTKDTNPSRHLQGKEASAIIELYFDLCHLKQIYRQGWLQHGISPLRCESVADHSFGVAMLVMFLADQYAPELDMAKLLRLSLLHDFGEIDAGDVTPNWMKSKAERRRRVFPLFRATRLWAALPNSGRMVKLFLINSS